MFKDELFVLLSWLNKLGLASINYEQTDQTTAAGKPPALNMCFVARCVLKFRAAFVADSQEICHTAKLEQRPVVDFCFLVSASSYKFMHFYHVSLQTNVDVQSVTVKPAITKKQRA